MNERKLSLISFYGTLFIGLVLISGFLFSNPVADFVEHIPGMDNRPASMSSVSEDVNIGAIYAELNRNILDVFNEYAIEIMTPAYKEDTEKPKLVPKSHWYPLPAQNPREKP